MVRTTATTSGAVLAVPVSQNAKLGATAATYTAQTGCAGCPLLDSGCYAQDGHMRIFTDRLNAAARAADLSPEELGQAEADAIADRIPPRRPLRLHVVGDSPTDASAAPVADACAARTGPTWGYTHFWRSVARATWRSVSMLASCERPADVRAAWQRGYAAALIVADFPGFGRFDAGDGIMAVPCPEQTGRAASCDACRLCWRDDLLVNRVAIAFKAHGARRQQVRAVLAASAAAATP
jgi:hypothetical protein